MKPFILVIDIPILSLQKKNKISFIGADWGGSDFESFNKNFNIIKQLDEQNINFLISLFIL